MAFDFDGAGVGVGPGDGGCPRLRWMSHHEGVPRSDRAPVEHQTQTRFGPLQQAVEDHGQVGLDMIDQVVEVVGLVSDRHDPIQRLPKDQRAGRPARQRREKGLRSRRRAFEQKPSAIGVGRQGIKVPTQAGAGVCLDGGESQPAALRKRGRLEPHAEAPEVFWRTRVEWVLVAKPHRALKLCVLHPVPIVEDRDSAGLPGPYEVDADLGGLGRHAVVDDVGQRRCC